MRWVLLVAGCVAACGEVKAPAMDATMPVDSTTLVDASVDAVPDAPPDTPPDAPPAGPSFDIAYTSQWEIRNTTSVGAPQVALIVNKSITQSMDLSQLTIADVADDHPTIIFNFQILNPATYALPPQQAGGALSPGAATFVNPFVSEPRFNTQLPTFDFTLNNIPAGVNATVNASASVRFSDQEVTLHFRFDIVAGGTSGGTIQAATRVSSSGF